MPGLDGPARFFPAERTLMARNRTALARMAFGVVLERFGRFLHMLRQGRPTSGATCRSGSASR